MFTGTSTHPENSISPGGNRARRVSGKTPTRLLPEDNVLSMGGK